MKLAILFLFFTSVIYPNEIKRIESIVEDISNLRTSYEKCKKELKDINPHAISNKIGIIKNNQNECEGFISEIKNNKDEIALLKNKDIELTSEILKKEKSIEKYKKILKIKEKTILTLENKDIIYISDIENKYIKLLKNKEKEINSLKSQMKVYRNTKKSTFKESNKFPSLMMKKKYQKTVKPNKQSLKVNKYITRNSAFSYRLLKDSSIYDSINGNILESWEKKTSFTSNKESLKWIKITGFFVNKIWQKADNALWIKKSNTIKREKR